VASGTRNGGYDSIGEQKAVAAAAVASGCRDVDANPAAAGGREGSSGRETRGWGGSGDECAFG
jgi:hypothetical protein